MDGFRDGRFADFVASADHMDGRRKLDCGVPMDPIVLQIDFEESHEGCLDGRE